MSLLAQRVAETYGDLVHGRPVGDSAFAAFSSLLEDDAAYRGSERFARDRQYWLARLSDQPELISLSRRRAGASGKPDGFLRQSAHLHPSCAARLDALVQSAGTSAARIITAAAAMFLHRMTGAEDLVLSLPVAARNPLAGASLA